MDSTNFKDVMRSGCQLYENASKLREMNFGSGFTADCDEYRSERLHIPCKTDKCTSQCSEIQADVLIAEKSGEGADAQIAEDISPADAVALIKSNQGNRDLVILDMSTTKEYLKWHVKRAKNINFFSLNIRKKLEVLDRNKTYLVYCKMGGRSKMAQKLMVKMGFREIYNIVGGRNRWLSEELPLGIGLARAPRFTFCPIHLTTKLMGMLRSGIT